MAQGLVLAWRAADLLDHQIWTSYFDLAVGTWDVPRALVGSRTNIAPQLCDHGPSGPLMTHKGETGDDNTYRRFIGNGIIGVSANVQNSQHLRSSWNLGVAVTSEGNLWCAWKGPNPDNRIRFSTDALSNHDNPHVTIFDNYTSHTSPVLAILPHGVYMFWRGEGDNNIYWAHSNFDLQWYAYTIPGAQSEYVPAVAVFNNTLVAVWRGQGLRLWWSFFEGGTNWSQPTEIPGTIASDYQPTLTVVGDRLYMAWHGTQDNPQIYWASTTGGDWSVPRAVPGALSYYAPALGTFGA
jgi:hypothetical protein